MSSSQIYEPRQIRSLKLEAERQVILAAKLTISVFAQF